MALNNWWFRGRLASAALLFSAALFVFAVSSGLAPCNRVFAQSTSCNVGDTEIFTGATEFQGVIEVGATPTAGDTGNILQSQGASAPPEWVVPGVIKSANETVNNSSTLQDDDELFFSVAASAKYYVDAVIFVTSNSTADFQFQFSVPSGAALIGAQVNCAPACSTGTRFTESAPTTNNVTSDTAMSIKMQFVVATDATSGTVTFRWAQGTMTAVDTIVLENSGWTVTRIE